MSHIRSHSSLTRNASFHDTRYTVRPYLPFYRPLLTLYVAIRLSAAQWGPIAMGAEKTDQADQPRLNHRQLLSNALGDGFGVDDKGVYRANYSGGYIFRKRL